MSDLVASQQAIDQEAVLSANSVQRQERPVRLVKPLPPEKKASHDTPGSRKRQRRKSLPLPSIQISQTLPCALCKTRTMAALLDFSAGSHDPWPMYPLCEEDLRQVLSKREETGLSLPAIIQDLIRPSSSGG
jgi:hypothetical protein